MFAIVGSKSDNGEGAHETFLLGVTGTGGFVFRTA